MSSNGENEQATQISKNLETSLHSTDHLSIDESNLKKRTNVNEFSPTIPSESLLKPERNRKISRESSVELTQGLYYIFFTFIIVIIIIHLSK